MKIFNRFVSFALKRNSETVKRSFVDTPMYVHNRSKIALFDQGPLFIEADSVWGLVKDKTVM
jgi:hypothetical protein